MNFNVNDIRPENLMEQKKPLLEADKEYLRSRRSLFIEVACPACQSTQSVSWGEKEGFTYQQCSNCATIFMSPRADENLSGEFYMQSKNYDFWNKYIFPATDAVRKEKIFKPRAIKTIEFCKKYDIHSGVLLEIGAAFGTYCESIKELNYFESIVAVEPTPGLAETCRQKGFTTYEQTVEKLSFPQSSADVIANFEVIEHLANPLLFIQQSVKFLRTGGLFICTCPNGLALGTLILKENAAVVDHEHVNYFNPTSLSFLLESAGMEVLEVCTPGELDTDLLKQSFLLNPEIADHNPFLKEILKDGNESVQKKFQIFLQESLLSSHMWIIARKK